jgi:hypothetical protein
MREHGEVTELEQGELLEQLARAHADWQAAQQLFSEFSDPELIEWATFHLKACEQHYRHLLHLARRAGLRGQVRLRA